MWDLFTLINIPVITTRNFSMSEISKRRFEGKWKRVSEDGLTSFLRFNGVPYLLSFPLAARGCNISIELSADLSTATVEATGVPCSPKTTFSLDGTVLECTVENRQCHDKLYWQEDEQVKDSFWLVSEREDPRPDGHIYKASVRRHIIGEGKDERLESFFEVKRESDGANVKCTMKFVRSA